MKKRSQQEPTLHDVLQAINDFATHVEERFVGHDQQFKSMDQQFKSMDQQFDLMKLEIAAIRETMATKMATKDDLAKLRSDMVGEIDQFVVLHQKLEHETAALSSRCGRIETFVGMRS